MTRMNWICPDCKTHNDDDIDPVYGPFVTCTCDNCGHSFDQESVPGITYRQAVTDK